MIRRDGPADLARRAEAPVRFTGFRVEHLKHVGWRLFNAETYVNWCGHAQEVIPWPRPDGLVTFAPGAGGGALSG